MRRGAAPIQVRDVDGRVRETLERLIARLEREQPAARHSLSDVARAVLLLAEDPAILHKLGLRGPALFASSTGESGTVPPPVTRLGRRGGMRR